MFHNSKLHANQYGNCPVGGSARQGHHSLIRVSDFASCTPSPGPCVQAGSGQELELGRQLWVHRFTLHLCLSPHFSALSTASPRLLLRLQLPQGEDGHGPHHTMAGQPPRCHPVISLVGLKVDEEPRDTGQVQGCGPGLSWRCAQSTQQRRACAPALPPLRPRHKEGQHLPSPQKEPPSPPADTPSALAPMCPLVSLWTCPMSSLAQGVPLGPVSFAEPMFSGSVCAVACQGFTLV